MPANYNFNALEEQRKKEQAAALAAAIQKSADERAAIASQTAANPGPTGSAINIPTYNYNTLSYSGGENAASDMAASLTRAQWNEWKTSGAPFEEWLQQQTSYMNPNLVPELAGKALNTAKSQYGRVADQGLQRMRDMGVPMTAGDYSARQRAIDVNKSAAAVDAANRIVAKIRNRDVELATGTPNSAGSYQGVRLNNTQAGG